MKRSEVRQFIRDGVNAITPVLEFGSGLVSDWNWKHDKTLPQAWQEVRPMTGDNPNQAPLDEWDIRIHIAKLDDVKSIPDQYEQIIDECDLVAQKLMYQFNKIVSGYKLVTLSARRREPFVKKHAHCLTGVILSFTINSPDKTNVC